ncbi:hypothetical protein GA0061081_11742 [Gilliamella bombicola]|uniref:Membrane domain of glycerophosphoryl diester phosphodiesterase n=1 Tax=Gilliamella bombicola TaxID=1798182 RepID=A0A1C4DII3_9GAMM|nr:hypothetical protein [Gilliamella sp. ESL0254]NUF28477.1 hypothetical protein [Gilliamella sp. ESL0254]SCC31115.1 hypothetical protein GA0061081_11742 [Gilliamella bombicola]
MEVQKKLTFSLIFKQTLNFTRNHVMPILFVSLMVALANSVITNYLYYLNLDLQLYLDLSPHIPILILALLIHSTMKSISIATVSNLNSSNKLKPKLFLSSFLSSMLKILGFYITFIFLVFLIAIILSLVFICLNFLLPSILILLLIALILIVPIIFFSIFSDLFFGSLADPKQKSFADLLSLNYQLVKKYWAPGLLMLLISGAFSTLLAKLGMTLDNENIILSAIISFASAFFDIFVTSFFYRLYSLATNTTSQNLPAKDDYETTSNLIV